MSMSSAEALLGWDKAISHAEDAIKFLKEVPSERSKGSNSDEACANNLLELAERKLRHALKEVVKLRGNEL
jgi:hypothetical protein